MPRTPSLLALLALLSCRAAIPFTATFRCAADQDCPAGSSCSEGVCAPCPSCPAGQTCSQGGCVPAPCATDRDCPSPLSCSSQGCVACPTCRPEETCRAGACVPRGCATDPDCPSGFGCAAGECRACPTCGPDEACQGAVCVAKTCPAFPCSATETCLAGACRPLWTLEGSATPQGSLLVADGEAAYLALTFSSPTLTLGANVVTNASATGSNVVLARVDRDGRVLWTYQLSTSATVRADRSWVGPTGALVVTGVVRGSLTGRRSGAAVDLTAQGEPADDDVFALQLGRDGALQWGARFGSGAADELMDATLASDGSLVGAGRFAGATLVVRDASGASRASLASRGGLDVFLFRAGPTGVAWVRGLGSNADDLTHGARDFRLHVGSGLVGFTGTFNATLSNLTLVDESGAELSHVWGDGAGLQAAAGALALDSGAARWLRILRAGSWQATTLQDSAMDADGRLVLSASFSAWMGVYDEAGHSLYSTSPVGGTDALVLSFSPQGALDWLVKLGGADDDWGYELALGPDGDVFLGGGMGAGASGFTLLDRAGAPLATFGGFTSREGDVFLARFAAADGRLRWSRLVTGASWELRFRPDASGRLLVLGRSSASLELRTPSGAVGTLAGAGGEDSYLLCLGPEGAVDWWRGLQGPGTDFDPQRSALYLVGDLAIVHGVADAAVQVTTPSGTLAALAPRSEYLAAFAADGSLAWHLAAAAAGDARFVPVFAAGRLLLRGKYSGGPLTLSGSAGPLSTLDLAGGTDAFFATAELPLLGAFRATRLAGALEEGSTGTALLSTGEVLALGASVSTTGNAGPLPYSSGPAFILFDF